MIACHQIGYDDYDDDDDVWPLDAMMTVWWK